MLRKFGMADCALVITPITTSCRLIKEDESPLVDSTIYRSKIGSLLYLTTSRPNIMHSVIVLERFQSSPEKSHVIAIKRIFRYLNSTPNLGLWYPRTNNLR